jgi:integrase
MPIVVPPNAATGKPKKKLLDLVRDVMRLKHYSLRTERTYCDWITRFIRFHQMRHPAEMSEAEVGEFLTDLARSGNVSASTQNQALSALLFLYKEVLKQEIGWLQNVERAKKSVRLPTVLTRDEVHKVFAHLHGTARLMAGLLYGSGLRLMECVRLRVKDIDFGYARITVRDARGAPPHRALRAANAGLSPNFSYFHFPRDFREKGCLSALSALPGGERCAPAHFRELPQNASCGRAQCHSGSS